MSNEPSSMEEMLAALREKFLENLPERFAEVEALVLELEDQENPQVASELFRKIHSLKGSAGTYGAMILSTVCHHLEDYLAGISTPRFTQQQTSLVLRYVGLLRSGLLRVAEGAQEFPEVKVELEALRKLAFEAPLSALIVLPSRSVRKIVLSALGALPLQAVTVDDGLAALQRLLHQPFDLLITGLKIPELNGPALIGATRLSETNNKDIPTIVVTTRGAAELEFPEVATPDLVVTVDPQLSQLGAKVASLLGLRLEDNNGSSHDPG